jgi:hypothetical protein
MRTTAFSQRSFGAWAALAALMVMATSAWALPTYNVGTSDGTGADSFVRLGQPNTNKGTSTDITIKDTGTSSTTRQGYMRFDLAGLPSVMTDSTLSLVVSNNSSGGGNPPPNQYTVSVYGLNDGHAGEGWIESGAGSITWNNAPANDTAREFFDNDAAFLGRFIVPASAAPTTVTFSDDALKSFLTQDTDGRASVLLTRDGGGGSNNLVFASKEHPSLNEPRLAATGSFSAFVQQVTTNDGLGADSYVRKGSATTNFGNATSILTKNNGTSGTTRKGYLRFELPTLFGGVLDAALNMEVTTNNQGGGGTTPQNQTVNVWGLNDLDPGELWDESGITWNNAPANLTGGNGIDSSVADFLGSFDVPNHPETDSKPIEVMFSSQDLIDFINADTNGVVTLILQRQNSQGSWNLAFASGENFDLMPPTLTLGIFMPEPGTATLLVAGGLALIRRRRRRG